MKIPSRIPRPKYNAQEYEKARKVTNFIKTREQISRMRIACAAARVVLDKTIAAVKAGVSTDELNAIAHEESIRQNSYPSPLGYHGFPKSVCTSINDVVCHGIPGLRKLKNGDIINIDVTCFKEGMHGDCSETVLVGNVDKRVEKLVKDTQDAMNCAIDRVRPGIRIREIGRVIRNLAKAGGYGNVDNFCGHGIGEFFHMLPNIPHVYDPKAKLRIREGMTFTIEPMFCLGSAKNFTLLDGWTEVTKDGLPSAQFEQTILVTKNGSEVLTRRM